MLREGSKTANEDKKDFNAMLNDGKDMPKIQIITDEASIKNTRKQNVFCAAEGL